MRPHVLAAFALVVASIAGVHEAGAGAGDVPRGEAGRTVSSLASSPVTVYSAKWCPACRALEGGLRERKIGFEVVDVEESPAAFAKARSASGSGGAIPLTSVTKTSGTVWIVGADVDAVDKAQRGE